MSKSLFFVSKSAAADPSDRVMPGKRILPGSGAHKPHLQKAGKGSGFSSKEASKQAEMFNERAAAGQISVFEAQKPPKRPKVTGPGKWGGFQCHEEKKDEIEVVQAKNREAAAEEEKKNEGAKKKEEDKIPDLEGAETYNFYLYTTVIRPILLQKQISLVKFDLILMSW